jgi:hypothetical protein
MATADVALATWSPPEAFADVISISLTLRGRPYGEHPHRARIGNVTLEPIRFKGPHFVFVFDDAIANIEVTDISALRAQLVSSSSLLPRPPIPFLGPPPADRRPFSTLASSTTSCSCHKHLHHFLYCVFIVSQYTQVPLSQIEALHEGARATVAINDFPVTVRYSVHIGARHRPSLLSLS